VARGVGAVLLPALVVGGLLLATLWALWRRPGLGFLAAAFFLALAPTSSVLPIADLCVEHRMYLPLAPLALLAVLAVLAVAERLAVNGATQQHIAGGVLLLVGLLLGARTVLRNEDYRNPMRLWAGVVAQRPGNWRGHYNLALLLEKEGLADAAMGHFRASLRLNPGQAVTRYNLGVLLEKRGDLREAVRHYRSAVQLNPARADAHNNLATTLGKLGRFEEAERHCRISLRLRPNSPETEMNLAACLERQGNLADAVVHIRKAVRLKPAFAEAHYVLGLCLLQQGRKAEAGEHFRIAARINPHLKPPASAPSPK
jgi:Flp pilus assembly protein TadD